MVPGAFFTGHLYLSGLQNNVAADLGVHVELDQIKFVLKPTPTIPPLVSFAPYPVNVASDFQALTIYQVSTILSTNQAPPSPIKPPGSVICGNGKFPFSSDFEWTPNSAQDAPLSGVAGGAHISATGVPPDKRFQGDLAATHPFGLDPGSDTGGTDKPQLDYDTYISPDPPYKALLGQGNYGDFAVAQGSMSPPYSPTGTPDGDYVAASKQFGAPVIGMETDQQLLPPAYAPNLGNQPQRVAMFGTWITDCGHTDYHSEIHPPLLTAKADPTGSFPYTGTFATLIGRPYWVRPVDRVDDSANANQEPFLAHLESEITRAMFLPGYAVQFRARVDIPPFAGNPSFNYTVAPPNARPNAKATLMVRYHFVVRPGVQVHVDPQLGDDLGRVGVTVNMYHNVYVGESLGPAPSCRMTFNAWKSGFGDATTALSFIFGGALGNALSVLASGIQVTCYPPLTPPPDPSTLPADNQVVADGSPGTPTLPWPVYGFISVSWASA